MGFSNLITYLAGRRRRSNVNLADETDARVRIAQDVMEETVERLHAEIMQMHADHQRERDESRQLYLEMAQALRDRDRDRVHLTIRIAELQGDT